MVSYLRKRTATNMGLSCPFQRAKCRHRQLLAQATWTRPAAQSANTPTEPNKHTLAVAADAKPCQDTVAQEVTDPKRKTPALQRGHRQL